MNKPPDPLLVALRSPLLILDLPRSLLDLVIPSIHLQFHVLRSPTLAFALLPTIAQSPAWILLLLFASSSASPRSPSCHSRTHHVWLHTLVNCGCLLLLGGLRSCQALRIPLFLRMPTQGNYSVQNLGGCCGLIGSIRGPRSAWVERSCSDWQVRSIVCGWAGLAGSLGGKLSSGSVSLVSYGSVFLSRAQVCSYLSPLFYFVPMDYAWTPYSNAWRNIDSGSSNYWCDLLTFNWLWSCLRFCWLIDLEVPDGTTAWVANWHRGDAKPRLLLFWVLVCPDYGLIFAQFRPSRIAPFDSISFTIWANLLLSRLLLSYLVCLSTISLFDWCHRLLCSLCLKQLSGTTHMHSSRLGPLLLGFWICVMLSVSRLSGIEFVVVSWLGFPWFQTQFALGEVCWSVLLPACYDHYNDNADSHILSGLALHFCVFAIFCLFYLRKWLCYCSHCFILFGEMSLSWLGFIHMVPGLTVFYLPLHCLGFLSVPTPLSFLCFWWQVSISLTSHLQFPSLRCLYLFSMDQHVYMLCLHPWMLGYPFLGGWFNLWLMLSLHSNFDVGYAPCLLWTFPSFLLSSPLASKLAPTLVVLHTCVCWHLDCVQLGRDEGRGKSPIVYDEDHSETKMFIFSSVLWLEFSFYWWPSLDLHLRTCMPKMKLELSFAAHIFAFRVMISKTGQNMQSLISVSELWCITISAVTCVYSALTSFWLRTGLVKFRPQQSFFQHTRRAASRLECYNRVFGAIANSIVSYTSLLCCLVGMYFPCTLSFSFSFQLEFTSLFVVERLQCNNRAVVRCIFAFIICDVTILTDLEQHLCVLGMCLMTLGPCLMALEQHRRMLRIACCLLFGLLLSNSTFVCSDRVVWHLIRILECLVMLLAISKTGFRCDMSVCKGPYMFTSATTLFFMSNPDNHGSHTANLDLGLGSCITLENSIPTSKR